MIRCRRADKGADIYRNGVIDLESKNGGIIWQPVIRIVDRIIDVNRIVEVVLFDEWQDQGVHGVPFGLGTCQPYQRVVRVGIAIAAILGRPGGVTEEVKSI